MTDKITLGSIATFQNDTSAVAQYNANNATLTSALDNTLSRDGTQPNQMGSVLDMNSNRIINLPAPTSNFDAVRFADITSIGGGGSVTVNPLPTGGSSGQTLTKNSSTNFDASWQSVISGVNVTAGKTLSATNTLTLSGTDGTVVTFPSGGGNIITDTSTATLSNKTINTASGNSILINGSPLSAVTGSGSAVLSNSPVIASPTVSGSFTATNLINNTALTQMAAVTLKGNPTSGLSNASDFTINGLTTSSSPDGANDYLMIWDHTSGTLKKVNPTTIAGANTVGVSSIASLTGAFTLGAGLTNSSNVLLADATYHRGYLSGYTMSAPGGAQVLTVTAGVACSDDFSTLMKIASTYTKTIASGWAVGSGNGGLDTGSVAASTWYHVYVIERIDTGVVDILFSVSPSAPTYPTNYTVKRRIGSIRTDGSSNITQFLQQGDYFRWFTPVLDLSNQAWTSTATLTTLTVPTGFLVEAWGCANGSASTGTQYFLLSDPASFDSGAGVGTALGVTVFGSFQATFGWRTMTNTSAQVRRKSSDPSGTGTLQTFGWYDQRGK